MIRFLTHSFFIRVAIGLAIGQVALLVLIAREFLPNETYVDQDGLTRHMFQSGVFLQEAVVTYFIFLGPVYLLARFFVWLMSRS